MDTLAIANEAPVRSLGRRPVRQSRVPRERHADNTTVDKIDDKTVVGNCHSLSPSLRDFSRG